MNIRQPVTRYERLRWPWCDPNPLLKELQMIWLVPLSKTEVLILYVR